MTTTIPTRGGSNSHITAAVVIASNHVDLTGELEQESPEDWPADLWAQLQAGSISLRRAHFFRSERAKRDAN